jgi:hypothetical protein
LNKNVLFKNYYILLQRERAVATSVDVKRPVNRKGNTTSGKGDTNLRTPKQYLPRSRSAKTTLRNTLQSLSSLHT